jgi:hypothetical protein
VQKHEQVYVNVGLKFITGKFERGRKEEEKQNQNPKTIDPGQKIESPTLGCGKAGDAKLVCFA